MDNQTRINLIETLIKTLETYRVNTETPSREQTLTAALQDEISNLMTEKEFTNWIDTGEFKEEIEQGSSMMMGQMNIIFNTGRYYGIEQLIHLVIEKDEIKFSDHARNIHGRIEINSNRKALYSFDYLEEEFLDAYVCNDKEKLEQLDNKFANLWGKFFLDHYDLGKYDIWNKEIHLAYNKGYKLHLAAAA